MALSHSQTLVLDAVARATANQKIHSIEKRGYINGFLATAYRNRSSIFSVDQLENFKRSARQPTWISVMKRTPRTTGSTRTCNPTGPLVTDRVTLTWQTITANFDFSVAQALDDVFTTGTLEITPFIEHGISEAIKAFDRAVEIALYTAIDSNISDGSGEEWGHVLGAYQIPQSDWDTQTNRASYYYNRIAGDMQRDDLEGPYDTVVDPGAFARAGEVAHQNEQNAVNQGWQLGQFSPLNSSSAINNSSHAIGTIYVAPQGAYSVLFWTQPSYRTSDPWLREGLDGGVDKMVFNHPGMPGVQLELLRKKECKDNSEVLEGTETDTNVAWQISGDISVVMAYSSTSDTFIRKYELDRDNALLSSTSP